MVPRLNFPVIDVRDVALAHLRAMIIPEAVGHRHILVRDNIWMKDMAQVCTVTIHSVINSIYQPYDRTQNIASSEWPIKHYVYRFFIDFIILFYRHYQKNLSHKATKCQPFHLLMLESRSYHSLTKLSKWLPQC